MLKNPSSDQKSIATSKFPSNSSSEIASAIKCFQVPSAIKQGALMGSGTGKSKMEKGEATLMLKIIDEYEKANTQVDMIV